MKAKNILIYRLGSLGDTVIALPAFHAVRRAFPDARITLLTNRPVSSKAPPVAAILGNDDYFYNDVIDYPVGMRNPFQILKLVSAIRIRSIDCAINLSPYRSEISLIRDRLFFNVAGVKTHEGFILDAQDHDKYTMQDTGELEWEASRLARRVRNFKSVDLNDDSFWDLRLTDKEVQDASDLLSSIPSVSKVIALSVGTKVQVKEWGTDNWMALTNRLSNKLPGWTAIFTGAPDENSATEACLKEWSGPSLNLCGMTSPRVLAAVYKRCSLFVGHDSGPMHLAANAKIPCVAIFAAKHLPKRWFPRGDRNRILFHRTDCAGCGLDVCITERKRCILSITVDEVEAAVLDLVKTLGS